MSLFDRFRRRKPISGPPGQPNVCAGAQATPTIDVGPEAVDFLFSSMAIDEQWSIREPRGFTWWGHQLAQRVWADPARESYDTSVVRVHAETALLRDVPATLETVKKVAHFNRYASLNALLWNAEERRAALHCAMTVHQENLEWAKRLLMAAVGIQVADAHIKLTMAPVFGAQPDVSQHPQSGRRGDPDDMLNVISNLFALEGQGPSPFTEKDFETTLSMKPAPWILATGGGAGLTAEFPFTGNRPAAMLVTEGRTRPLETTLLTVSTEERHPQLGSGALLRLVLPIHATEDEAAETAARLNRDEAMLGLEAQFLGSWCTDSKLGICFVTFLPAAIYRRGILRRAISVWVRPASFRRRRRASASLSAQVHADNPHGRAYSHIRTRKAAMSSLHPVKNLAPLRLVLVFCDEPFVAHGLELTQTVSIACSGRSHSRPNVTGITLQAEVGASIGLVLAVSEVGDDGGGPGRVETRTDQLDKSSSPPFGSKQRPTSRVVVPISMDFIPAPVGSDRRYHKESM